MLLRLLVPILAAGICYRLWDQDDVLEEVTPPEICDADLAPLVLELALWGCPDGRGLAWLDPPSTDRLEAAALLLQELGALSAAGVCFGPIPCSDRRPGCTR